MAKKATGKSRSTAVKKSSPKPERRALAERRSTGGGRRTADNAADAFIKLLQSPLVAELVAVAATAALATLAEQGFTSRGGGGGSRGKRAGVAVKEAGKAAAAAVGRRLSTEIEEIRNASKSKGGAKA